MFYPAGGRVRSATVQRPTRSPLAPYWSLDPDVVYLNHGSFGAAPVAVLERQAELRARLEREPVRFLAVELEGLLDEARGRLAAFVGAEPDDLAFVVNATSGVNAVLRSLDLAPGDELLRRATSTGRAATRSTTWPSGPGAGRRRGAAVPGRRPRTSSSRRSSAADPETRSS